MGFSSHQDRLLSLNVFFYVNSLDFPKATSILGNFVGSAVLRSILNLNEIPQLLEGDFGVEPKREFASAVFKRIQSQAGDADLAELCNKAGLKASQFLTADSELDPEADGVDVWLKKEGLTNVVPL